MLNRKLDLQLFANDGNNDDTQEVIDDTQDVNDTQDVGADTNDVEERLDLLDLLDKDENIKSQFQSELDRAITKAIQTRDKKHQEELKKQEQRANMTAEELQREKMRELEEREEEIREYELKLKKVEYFKDNGMPLDLIDFVIVNDEEEIEEKATALQTLINAEVEKQVKARVKDNGIDLGGDTGNKPPLSMEELAKLSPEEINRVWADIQ